MANTFIDIDDPVILGQHNREDDLTKCFPFHRKLCFLNEKNLLAGTELGDEVLYDINGKSYICLFVESNAYQVTIEGEATRMAPTGSGSYVKYSLIRKGFTAQFDYTTTDVLVSLDKIAKDAIREKKFVEVIDYVRPETEDYDKGFTIRKGLIYLPLTYSGLMSGQKEGEYQGNIISKPTTRPILSPEGFSLTFTENSYKLG
jgi:hypothetical protein